MTKLRSSSASMVSVMVSV